MPFRNQLFSRFAAASLALGAGTAGAWGAVPTDVLAEWVEADLEGDPEATPLLALNDADKAASRASAAVAALWSKAKEDAEALARELARADSKAVKIGAAAALGRILELSAPAERIELVCRWTTSDEASDRIAIARALGLRTPVFVADLAIAELARDPDPSVRAAVVRAVRAHFHEAPDDFATLASTLVTDSEQSVRKVAQELLSDLG